MIEKDSMLIDFLSMYARVGRLDRARANAIFFYRQYDENLMLVNECVCWEFRSIDVLFPRFYC